MLAHEIGDAVWRSARSPEIDESAVLEGVLSAAEVIGRKLLEPQVFSAIRGERYRSIMKKMSSDSSTTHVRRSELAARLSPSERGVMDNFLRRMKKLGALEADPNVRGGYRFPNRLHALSISGWNRSGLDEMSAPYAKHSMTAIGGASGYSHPSHTLQTTTPA